MKKSILLFAATLFAAATFAQTPTVSASSVTFKYCETTDTAFSITVPAGMLPYFYNGEYIDEFGTSVHTLVNARGCDSIVAVTLVDSKGAIPFAFTIDENGTKVYFSQGNLQYCAAPTSGPTTHKVANPTGSTQPGIFRFAEHQYDFVGNASVGNVYENNTKCNNIKLAEDYSGWIDLFTWGGTGYGGDGYEPYSASSAGSPGHNQSINYSSNQKYYDYGIFNAISNGGNEPGMWIMLTNQQWGYIFDGRTNAHKKIATAKVAGITGTILLPDEWTLPQGLSFEPLGNTTNNTYTAEQWKLMEANGAVFLMNNGYMSRDNNKYTYQTSPAYYWTTTWNDNPYVYQGIMATSESNNVLYHYANQIYPYYRASVRLVRKVQ